MAPDGFCASRVFSRPNSFAISSSGYLAYEHDWSKTLSSTIGVGYINVRNKPFEADLAFDRGYKPLVNLFFRPRHGSLKGLTVAAEVEYAHRINVDNSESSTTRAAVLMYYDF